MSSANEVQFGGRHYKRGGALQHWDIVSRYGVGYLEGCSSKYVYRFQDKAGKLDLEKAGHYVDKLLELCAAGLYPAHGKVPFPVVAKFCADNKLSETQTAIMHLLLRWRKVEQLILCREKIDLLISERYPEN